MMEDHYWIVADDENRPWSSRAALVGGSFQSGYIDRYDEEFQRRLSGGVDIQPTRIISEAELRDVPIAIVSGLTMLSRLTPEEYVSIRQAEIADLATIGRWLDALRMNGEINLFGLTAEAARQGLVRASLLSQQRAAEVFACK